MYLLWDLDRLSSWCYGLGLMFVALSCIWAEGPWKCIAYLLRHYETLLMRNAAADNSSNVNWQSLFTVA